MNYRMQLAASAAILMAKGDDKGAAAAPAEAPAVAQVAEDDTPPEGVRQRRGIMPKQFLPTDDPDWIMKNIVAQGRGTRANLGRVFGICTGYEVRTNTLPNGQEATSIALTGAFQTESFMTGELGDGTLAFLPAAYSEKVKAIFDANEIRAEDGKVVGNNIRMIQVDVDVGVEATGKPIPYEWVITAYREGEEMAVLRAMRRSRPRPAFVLQSGAKVIEAIPRRDDKPLPMLSAPDAAQAAPEPVQAAQDAPAAGEGSQAS